MGIDDIVKNNTEKKITSRKDPANVSVPESAWIEIAVINPDSIYSVASRVDKNDARCLAALLEDILENRETGWDLNEEELERIKHFRDEIVDSKNL